MSTAEKQCEKYENDSRIPCRYGDKCYQKNSEHLNKYKHPPKTKRKFYGKCKPSKKVKPNEVFEKNKEDGLSTNSQKKNECISSSDSESEKKEIELKNDQETKNLSVVEQKEYASDEPDKSNQFEETQSSHINEPFDPKKFIKSRFLVEFPDDFYNFWEFCKDLEASEPCNALKEVGLQLVGAYDVLAGKFRHVKKSRQEYLQHWRYYYDPPEVLTVIRGDNNTGYHIGYFYDSPNETPSFLVSNHGTKDGVFMKNGENIFAAVSLYLEDQKKHGDPFKKMHIGKLLSLIKTKAEKLNLNLSSHSKKIRERENKVVTKTFNKIGLVVPYNKKTQLGYRDLAMADKELMNLLTKLEKASLEQKSKYLSDLQPVLTYANIALDECDFGTGVKLGWELLYHGIDSLNSTINQFLSNSYRLLNREAFAKIAEAHMSNRKKGSDLSIL